MDIQELHDVFKACLPVQIGNKKIIYIDRPRQLLSIGKEFSDEEYMSMTCRPVAARTGSEMLAFYEKHIRERKSLLLGIQLDDDHENDTDNIIGRISFFDCNPRNKSMEFGFLLIKKYRNHGIMKEAIRQVIKILFSNTEIRKIYAQTGSFNMPSISLLKKLGFHLDGVLREHHELNGRFYDDHIYSLLAAEFKQSDTK